MGGGRDRALVRRRTARAFRIMPRPSMRRWTDQADAAALLAAVARIGMRRHSRAPARLPSSRRCFAGEHRCWREAGLADPDPMVRIGALDMLESVPAGRIWPLASPLLADPVRGVRIRAAALLAAVPAASQPPADRERFDHGGATNSSRRNDSMPTGRKRAPRSANFMRAARTCRGSGGRIQGGVTAEPAIRAGRNQSCRSLSGARPGWRRRKPAATAIASSPRRRGAASCSRPDARSG